MSARAPTPRPRPPSRRQLLAGTAAAAVFAALGRLSPRTRRRGGSRARPRRRAPRWIGHL